MANLKELLDFTKEVVLKTAQKVINHRETTSLRVHTFDDDLKREMKAFADQFIEKHLIFELEKRGIPILSEECGAKGETQDSDYLFIIDPLDGTFNYVKNFGACAISVALWHKDEPIFGVIYDLDREELYWGGKDYGAFCDSHPLGVSIISEIGKSLVCSGFPVRYDLKDLYTDNYMEILSNFAKVRMIGSAAISIINVARGVAEAYFEKNIMIWDVAAGIAIAEGAGASYILIPTQITQSFDVIVSNNKLLKELKGIIDER